MTPEQRRVRALEKDPEYGPMLKKLTKPEREEVLGYARIIEGRQARLLLKEFDAARREQVRLRSKRRRVLQYATRYSGLGADARREHDAWAKMVALAHDNEELHLWKLYGEIVQ